MKRLSILAALALVLGCVDYNEQCTGLTENPDEVIGYLGQDVYIDKANARHANNAIGQMVADAMRAAPNSSGEETQFAAINGGAIRAEGLCVTRNIIPKGELTNGRLHEILLFNDLVESLRVSKSELVDLVENSVAGLSQKGQTISDPSGSFLQISGGHTVVDCSRPAGDRLVSFTIGDIDVLNAPDDTQFRIATLDFNLHSGDGFEELRTADQDAWRNPAQANQFGGSYSDISAAFMEDHFGDPEGPGLVVDPTRVEWAKRSLADGGTEDTCATPGRPPPS
jgi:2',3'-cyclic-nucleotide 2'-phosphodiesterase (5'-nucleotidase family)